MADAEICSASCKTDGTMKMDFLINKTERSVLTRYYYRDEKTPRSIVTEACKIFDEKNWVCDDKVKLLDHGKSTVDKMTDGVYVNVDDMAGAFSCAK